MGKPFKDEIKRIPEIFKWIKEIDTKKISEKVCNSFSNPLLVVGSGGSLSACYFIANLQQDAGGFAKAITPLDIYNSRKILNTCNLLFISSSGKNSDILFGYKTAIQCEPNQVTSICMKLNSPLAKLSNSHTSSNIFEFSIPTGKDGFLATNSLIAYFLLLYKVYGHDLSNKSINSKNLINFENQVQDFVKKISTEHSLTILYGNWGLPVAVDLESKFTEAALCSSNLSDYRNFGHGRHHWFAKKADKSALIALITPEEKRIAEKTLNILPDNIPTLIIESEYSGSYASIDLLIKSFILVKHIGEIYNIDPGRPGVPEFGRKLYNLKYSSFYKEETNKKLTKKAAIAIKRKKQISDINDLNEKELGFWNGKYNKFVSNLENTKLGIIIFDYDDTLCSANNRKTGPSEILNNEIIKILSKGYIIGIVTGRGKSVRLDMQKYIPSIYWGNIVIGYYNGAQIGLLNDNSLPNKDIDIHPSLLKLNEIFIKHAPYLDINMDLRPSQLSVTVNSKKNLHITKQKILEQIYTSDVLDLLTLESGHSIDIIPNNISKLTIISHCVNLAKKKKIIENYICIGDKGKYPGNDFKLLNTPNSLSVNEVSTNPDNCWNLAEVGLKNTDATLFYLNKIIFKKDSMSFKI